MIVIFFAASLGFYLFQNIANKEFGRRYGKIVSNASIIQNGMVVCFSALIMALPGGVTLLSPFNMLLAFLFGAFYLLTVYFILCGFTEGSMGGTTLLCNIGMFLSALFGVIVFRDSFTPGIVLGMVCMLLAVILSTPRGEKGGSKKWFAYALASGLSNGIVASVKGTAVRLNPDLDMRIFLFWGFLFSSLLFMLLLLTRSVRIAAAAVFGQSRIGPVLCGLAGGVGTSLANLFQMRALEDVSSAIVYPFTAGFLVVILWLVSFLVYKEDRFSLPRLLSLILCIAAVIAVNLK